MTPVPWRGLNLKALNISTALSHFGVSILHQNVDQAQNRFWEWYRTQSKGTIPGKSLRTERIVYEDDEEINHTG